MKMLGILSVCIILLTLSGVQRGALLDFILIGAVPFTNYTLSAQASFFFWLLIIPAFWLGYRLFATIGWMIIEKIGIIHQRHLNNRGRIHKQPALHSYQRLFIITLIAAKTTTKETIPQSITKPRRRFAALPL